MMGTYLTRYGIGSVLCDDITHEQLPLCLDNLLATVQAVREFFPAEKTYLVVPPALRDCGEELVGLINGELIVTLSLNPEEWCVI